MHNNQTDDDCDGLTDEDNPFIVAEQNLVAAYLFNTTAEDASANGLDGSVQGALPCVDRLGQTDSAFCFDGIDDYIEFPDDDLFSVNNTGELTISVWIAPSTTRFAQTESSGYVHWFGKGVIEQHEWTFRMYSDDNTDSRQNRLCFYLFNLDGGFGAGSYVQEDVAPNQWLHLVATVDGVNIAFYKNGLLKDTDPYPDEPYYISPANGSAPIRIGTRDFGSFFAGAIDDVRIFNRVLSQSEIQITLQRVMNTV